MTPHDIDGAAERLIKAQAEARQTAHNTPCGHPHDPEPWVSYTMMTGSAGGWRGQEKFSPRPSYCQELECYQKAKAAREEAVASVATVIPETPIYDEVVAVYPHIELPEPVTVEDPHPATELLPIITLDAIEGEQ